jgi:sialate O-acetylesterase
MKNLTFLKLFLLTVFISMSYSSSIFAQISTSKMFRSGAVVQREVPIPVWGWGDAGSPVTVTFADSVRATTVTPDGTWKVNLPSFEAGGPYSLNIASGEQSNTYTDIMVGDVYMISGQSNMEWSLSASDGGITESATANFENIREFKINKATSAELSDQLGTAVWKKATSGTAGTFSAVGYYFAKGIHSEKGIAIGLINNSYGGARIEAFMSEQMLGFDENDVVLANGEIERQPTLIYNKMVHPILPFAYKGILWYQAASNGDSMEDALEYGTHFKNMITAWRDSIGLGDLPFLWVQLPNFGEPVGDTPSTWDAWPQLRAQQSSALELPNTGEAITIDVGGEDIHPTNKEPVGYRLSLLARKIIYGDNVVAHSPRYKSSFLTDSGTVTVNFDSLGSGLTTPDGYDSDSLTAFALAGENNQYLWANARIEGDHVVVWHDDIPEPKTIRYAWEYNPGTISLYNQEGLPAAPFQATINPGFGIGSFRSARTAIEEGQSTTLSWEVFNASSVTLDGTPVDTMGSQSVSPTETTMYELIAINRDDSLEMDTAHVTVQVLDPAAINRTYGKPVTASTYETCCGEPLIPEYATDEDMETRWSSAWSDGTGDNPVEPQYDGTPDDEWIAVDLAEYISIDQVILNWEAAYGSSYDIETSLDRYIWNTAFEERSSDGGEDNIILSTPVTGRFLRIHGIERATEYGYSLFEIAAYGEVSDIHPPFVSLSSAAGNLVTDMDSVEISATVADEDGAVQFVAFYVDGTLTATVTEEPFAFHLQLGEEAKYVVTAIATDDSDLSIQSAPISIFQNKGDFTRFEAEDATTTGEANIASSKNASGESYLDLRDAWTVTFDKFNLWEPGEHIVNIRYQMTYDTPKSQYLVLNGDTVETIEFTAPNMADWLNKAVIVDFEETSDNEIAIHGFWNWMSIDYIEVQGVNTGLSSEDDGEIPNQVTLYQNYPNPFNPSTQISFSLPNDSHIHLRVFDVTGRLVATLIDGQRQAGTHQISYDARNLSSGIYFYQISGSFGVLTQKMTLIK